MATKVRDLGRLVLIVHVARCRKMSSIVTTRSSTKSLLKLADTLYRSTWMPTDADQHWQCVAFSLSAFVRAHLNDPTGHNEANHRLGSALRTSCSDSLLTIASQCCRCRCDVAPSSKAVGPAISTVVIPRDFAVCRFFTLSSNIAVLCGSAPVQESAIAKAAGFGLQTSPMVSAPMTPLKQSWSSRHQQPSKITMWLMTRTHHNEFLTNALLDVACTEQ